MCVLCNCFAKMEFLNVLKFHGFALFSFQNGFSCPFCHEFVPNLHSKVGFSHSHAREPRTWLFRRPKLMYMFISKALVFVRKFSHQVENLVWGGWRGRQRFQSISNYPPTRFLWKWLPSTPRSEISKYLHPLPLRWGGVYLNEVWWQILSDPTLSSKDSQNEKFDLKTQRTIPDPVLENHGKPPNCATLTCTKLRRVGWWWWERIPVRETTPIWNRQRGQINNVPIR